jgi:hypothetical protein
VGQRYAGQVGNDPPSEQEEVDIDKGHAAGEAGDGVGQPLLPAPLLLLTVVAHEEGANIPFDHLRHAGRRIRWCSVWGHRYLLLVPALLWTLRRQGRVATQMSCPNQWADDPDFAHFFRPMQRAGVTTLLGGHQYPAFLGRYRS